MRKDREGLRVGVAGVGYWGSKHVRALRDVAGVREVVGIDPRFTRAGDALGGDRTFVGLTDALPEVDAVVIAAPPGDHAELAGQAIRAGKHVLAEHPLATTTAAARDLTVAAQAAGVVLMPGHAYEHNPGIHALRDLVHQRDLGQLHYLDFALNLGRYQPGVNVVTDLAPHDISLANFVLGSCPTTVRAWGSRHLDPDYEDIAHLQLDYANIGVRTHIHVSWLDSRRVRRVTAVGSEKMAVYNDLASDDRLRVYDKAPVPPGQTAGVPSQVAYRVGGVAVPLTGTAEPLAAQDQHFVDCVLSGARPLADSRSGLAVVQALECAQVSLAEQRPVELTEVTALRLASVPAPAA